MLKKEHFIINTLLTGNVSDLLLSEYYWSIQFRESYTLNHRAELSELKINKVFIIILSIMFETY